MITQEVQQSAFAVASNLAEQGLFAQAKGYGPIALLTSVLGVKADGTPTSLNNVLPDAEQAAQVQFEQLADEIAKSLSGHLNYARNVVAPTVTDFVESIIPHLERETHNGVSDVEIIPVSFPALALNDDLGVGEFAVSLTENLPSMHHANPRTDEEVQELMLVGKASLDADIHEFIAQVPTGTLASIWQSFFMDGARASSSELFTDPRFGVYRALVVYLVASKLAIKPESDCNAPIAAYEELALRIRNQAGTHIVRIASGREWENEAGVLVLAEIDKKIFVNSTVYDKFLLTGGSNEIILGRWLKKDKAVTVKTLSEKGQELADAWRTHCTKLLSSADNRRHLVTVSLLIRSFPEFIATLSEDIAATDCRFKAVERFNECVRTQSTEATRDVHALALKAICKALFDHTDAYIILDGVARIGRLNPDATAQDCASVSVLEYLGTWAASCLEILKINNN